MTQKCAFCLAAPRRSRAETKMHCVRLLGERLMVTDVNRQAAEWQVHVAVLNGFATLGTFITETIG